MFWRLHMQRLKKLRLEKGVSQKEVAEYLNVSQQTVSRYETSDNLSVSQDILVQLADYYHVTTDYILSGKREYILEKDSYGSEDVIDKEFQDVYRNLTAYNRETVMLVSKRLLGSQEK